MRNGKDTPEVQKGGYLDWPEDQGSLPERVMRWGCRWGVGTQADPTLRWGWWPDRHKEKGGDTAVKMADMIFEGLLGFKT